MAGLRGVYDHLRAGQGDFVIVADHASNAIPPDMQQLGLSDDALKQHIAWDIGTHALAHSLSGALGSEAIISSVSRLVIDKNRRLDQPGLMPDVSDGIAIPGNEGLTQAQQEERIAQYYQPYHKSVAAAVSVKSSPFIISLHSFTPRFSGVDRPWDCGLLYNTDDRLARRAIVHLSGLGFTVGDNEPYPGNVYNATMDRHAEAHGHPYLMLEIRNDLLITAEQVSAWTARITAMVKSF